MKKATILKFNAYYVTQGILLFIFNRFRLYVSLTDGWPLIKTKLNLLLLSATNNKKGKHGKYSVKVHSRKYSA